MNQPSNLLPGAVVIDANVVIAICAKETLKAPFALAELARYSSRGYQFYAPGVLISEALYVLCNQEQSGTLTPANFAQAITELENLTGGILPPPQGDTALVRRAAAIRTGYGCSRAADSIYLALAEELAQTRPTVLLTFDQGIPNQASRNAPTVTVQVLIP
jgi:predicted nucleic acid-binding protein